MRIVFSRKGFDSQYGGVPSLVLPDGRVCPLPIPSSFGRPARECRFGEHHVGQIAADLTGELIDENPSVHLDPDLATDSLARGPGWRPSFGQVSSAQSHLSNRGVGPGDLFLFFGWLQVGAVIDVERVGTQGIPSWLHDHPHVHHAAGLAGKQNTIYTASEVLSLDVPVSAAPSAGVFSRWTPALQLTAIGQTRSVWGMPTWMAPREDRPALSYHASLERWTYHGDELRLKSVAKGQEFVLDAAYYPGAATWARKLIEEHA